MVVDVRPTWLLGRKQSFGRSLGTVAQGRPEENSALRAVLLRPPPQTLYTSGHSSAGVVLRVGWVWAGQQGEFSTVVTPGDAGALGQVLFGEDGFSRSRRDAIRDAAQPSGARGEEVS
jgi:hypothetical protein